MEPLSGPRGALEVRRPQDENRYLKGCRNQPQFGMAVVDIQENYMFRNFSHQFYKPPFYCFLKLRDKIQLQTCFIHCTQTELFVSNHALNMFIVSACVAVMK